MTHGSRLPGLRRALIAPNMAVLAAVVLLVLCASIARAQGCSQCRETVGQTPAQTQSAYRRAIIVMVAAGCTVFGGAVLTLRRFR